MPVDVREGSITLDFAQIPAAAAGIEFTDYQYYENLADGATYTPPAQTQLLLCNAVGGLASNGIHVEFYDDSGWINAHFTTSSEATCHIFQDTSQNVRVYNNSGSAKRISLTGVTWTAGFTDYRYYTSLAATSSYTPPAKSIASLFTVNGRFSNGVIGVNFWDGSAWIDAHVSILEDSRMVFQDNGQNIRVENEHGSTAYKISLTGVTW